jgi:hypothetical protein
MMHVMTVTLNPSLSEDIPSAFHGLGSDIQSKHV